MDFVQPQGREQLRGNDYDWLLEAARHGADRGEPGPPVSIVIPVYNRREILARTLAALTHQTWPRDHMQIVVADDGSRDGVEEVIARYGKVFDLVQVRQDDRGFRLAEVRNRAIRAAKHDAIVQLDCDLLPEPGLVEAYARLLAASDRAALLGLRRYVDANAVSEAEIRADPIAFRALPDVPARVDWRRAEYAKTDDLRSAPLPFRSFVGGNVAFPRRLVDEVGGYCEAFQAWGREDTELGYRLYNAGAYFVPVAGATALHQEPPNGAAAAQAERAAGLSRTQPLYTEKCPLNHRRTDRSRTYEVPLLTVLVPTHGDPAGVARTVEAVRRQTLRDLDVVALGDEDEDAAIRRSGAAFFAWVPPGTPLASGTLERLVEALAAEPHGVLACSGDPVTRRAPWNDGAPEAVSRWLDRNALLFRKRDWSRARWGTTGGRALLRLPRVTELRGFPRQ